jgi:hypothetical protein
MSSFKHPVGSQPSRVYWRRRAVVIGALVLVLVVIVLIAVRPGAGSEASPAPTPTTSSPVAADAPHSSADATPAATPTATPTPVATSTANGTCTASQITLKPVTDRTTYTSLQQPQISMSITNNSATTCTMDLGSSQQVLTITSGPETYWTSKDCQVNGTHQNVKLTAGQTLTTPAIAWDRTRSSTSTCDSTRTSVPAGGASYHLSVSVGLIKSSTTALMVLN